MSKEIYQIPDIHTPQELVLVLNGFLDQISNRLDGIDASVVANAAAAAAAAAAEAPRMVYSEDEYDAKWDWIDGKKVWGKVIDFGALPNNTTKSVAHGVSSLDTVVRIEFVAKSSDGLSFISIPWVNQLSTGEHVRTQLVSGTHVQVTTANDWSGYTESKVILEYTKT